MSLSMHSDEAVDHYLQAFVQHVQVGVIFRVLSIWIGAVDAVDVVFALR